MNIFKEKEMKRICIYPKDVEQITGKSSRYSRDLIRKIKEINNKQPHQLVTVEEFSKHVGLKQEEVIKKLI